MSSDDDRLFGDLNRDHREDWRDDLLGLWLVGETLRLQREKRELQERLEQAQREREHDRLWLDRRAQRRRDRETDDEADDPDDETPAYPPFAFRPAPDDPPRPDQPPPAPAWRPWLIVAGVIALMLVLALAGGC